MLTGVHRRFAASSPSIPAPAGLSAPLPAPAGQQPGPQHRADPQEQAGKQTVPPKVLERAGKAVVPGWSWACGRTRQKKKAPGAQAAPRGSREGISPSNRQISEVFSRCSPLPSALGGCFSHISLQNESGHPRAELGAHHHLHPLPGSLSPPCPKAEGTEAELGLAAGRGWLQQRSEEGRGDWHHLHGASGEEIFSQKSSRGVPFPNLTSSASGRCEIPHLVQLIQRQIKIGARKSGSSVYLEVLDLVSAEGRHCKAWDPSSNRLF